MASGFKLFKMLLPTTVELVSHESFKKIESSSASHPLLSCLLPVLRVIYHNRPHLCQQLNNPLDQLIQGIQDLESSTDRSSRNPFNHSMPVKMPTRSGGDRTKVNVTKNVLLNDRSQPSYLPQFNFGFSLKNFGFFQFTHTESFFTKFSRISQQTKNISISNSKLNVEKIFLGGKSN